MSPRNDDSGYRRPESVLVVVFTTAGDVLLLRRREPADWWQSVTGSLRWGETPLHAALRELREETGLHGDADLEDCARINEYPIIEPWKSHFAPGVTVNREHVFRLRLPERQTVELAPDEHIEYVWLPRAEAAARATSPTDREAILEFVPAPV
ncbi:MAG TPA: dihydroneopterin triphosphate diphosphatase [Gammaproteobacteria bacterium]|nr:dihydroneopterin triphosphate diphosphatase [Gammaproteobacteria bacterium]